MGDLIAGVVVAVMLVPQAMAYAMLAGLPPEMGLYASIVPLVLYSLFGSSNALAVGPAAMVSLLVLTGVKPHAQPGSELYIQLVLVLTLLIGLLQLSMAGLKLGFLVNFVSHPVLIGFTNAAALVIAMTQLKYLLGTEVIDSSFPIVKFLNVLATAPQFQPTTVLISFVCIGLLLFFAGYATKMFGRIGLPFSIASTLSKLGPLIAVFAGAMMVWLGSLHDVEGKGIEIVGSIRAGLPSLNWIKIDLESIQLMLPVAFMITLVGYLESVSVAKSLAHLRREKVNANRELLGLGMANLGSCFSGGLPVTGGSSRSMVNHSAGVQTRLGPVITAAFVAISVVGLTPLFYYIPKAALASVIVVAVVKLINIRKPFELWKYSRQDAVSCWVTLIAVLSFGIQRGILMGIATTLMLLLYKKSRPQIVEVGRVGQTEHFRSRRRYQVNQSDGILAIRVDESINFLNSEYLESYIVDAAVKDKSLHSVLLIASAINDIDSTGIESLREIRDGLKARGIGFYLSDVKGRVSDRLKGAAFDNDFLENCIFLSAHEAIKHLSSSD